MVSWSKLRFSILSLIILFGVLGFASSATLSVNNQNINQRDVVIATADRMIDLQDEDGSWDWVVTDKTDSTGTTYRNIAGVNAEVLLDAYKLTGDSGYLNAAENTGNYILNIEVSKNNRYNAFNINFLYHLYDVTNQENYKNRADNLMNHILHEENYWSTHNGNYCGTTEGNGVNGCTASELTDAIISYRIAYAGYPPWDLYNFVEAGQRYENTNFANEIANEIKNYWDSSSFDSNEIDYILGLTGTIFALEQAEMNSDSYVTALLAEQKSDGHFETIDPDFGLSIPQATAYALMALKQIGETEAAQKAANFLASDDNFEYNGLSGWLESDGKEYSEVTSEAAQAIHDYIYEENNYFTIQDAIDGASTEDTIEVMSGTYDEVLSVNTNDLTIKAADEENPIISSSNNPLIWLHANNTILSGFEFIGTDNQVGIRLEGKNLYIDNNIINNVGTGIQTNTLFSEGYNTIIDNKISDVTVGISLQNSENIVKRNYIEADTEVFAIGSTQAPVINNIVTNNNFNLTDSEGFAAIVYTSVNSQANPKHVDGSYLIAQNNYWGTNDGEEIADMVSDNVDYSNWIVQGGETVTTIPDTPTPVNTEGTTTSITLTTSTAQTGTITVQQSSSDSHGGFSLLASDLGKFISIDAPDITNITEAEIRIYYTDAELLASHIDETTLKMYYYNPSTGWGEIPSTVNTAENYVSAITTHFSDYGLGGEPDTEGPRIQDVYINPNYPNLFSKLIMIYATITDPSGVADYPELRWRILQDGIQVGGEYNLPQMDSEGDDLYSGGIYIDQPKNNMTITYQIIANDTLGNTNESSSQYQTLFTYDGLPPTTDDLALDVWTNLDVEVTLTCEDTISGCNKTYYSINDVNQGEFTAPVVFTLSDTGEYQLAYHSTDMAGNVEEEVEGTLVRIDKIIPTSEDDYEHNNEWMNEEQTITLSILNDDELSPTTIKYCTDLDNTCIPNLDYSTPITISDEGTNYLRYQAIDDAGNIEDEVNEKIVKIDTTTPETRHNNSRNF